MRKLSPTRSGPPRFLPPSYLTPRPAAPSRGCLGPAQTSVQSPAIPSPLAPPPPPPPPPRVLKAAAAAAAAATASGSACGAGRPIGSACGAPSATCMLACRPCNCRQAAHDMDAWACTLTCACACTRDVHVHAHAAPDAPCWRGAGCNTMSPRLQPYVSQAATLCIACSA